MVHLLMLTWTIHPNRFRSMLQPEEMMRVGLHQNSYCSDNLTVYKLKFVKDCRKRVPINKNTSKISFSKGFWKAKIISTNMLSFVGPIKHWNTHIFFIQPENVEPFTMSKHSCTDGVKTIWLGIFDKAIDEAVVPSTAFQNNDYKSSSSFSVILMFLSPTTQPVTLGPAPQASCLQTTHKGWHKPVQDG